MKHHWGQFLLGIAVGGLLFGGAASAISGVLAEPSADRFYVDGRPVKLTAYRIGGSNYVNLREVGAAVGFNVYWDSAVFMQSGVPYTGTGGVTGITVPAAAAGEVDIEAVRQEIVDRTNALREDNGLPALAVDEKLTQAAQVRADEMAATSVYSHVRPDGSRRTTVTDCPYTTENIHCITVDRMTDPNKELAKLAVDGWAASEDHLEGMLDDVRWAIGVGVAPGVSSANGLPCWYCVQWFLRDGYVIHTVYGPVTQS